MRCGENGVDTLEVGDKIPGDVPVNDDPGVEVLTDIGVTVLFVPVSNFPSVAVVDVNVEGS